MTAVTEPPRTPPVFTYRVADSWEFLIRQAIHNAVAGRISWEQLHDTLIRWTDLADREGGV